MQDWHGYIIQNSNQPFSTDFKKNLKDFVVVNNELHHRGSKGILARCLSLVEEKEELHEVLKLPYDNNDVSLYRQL